MKDNRNIEDWYKNELENFNVKPSNDSWDIVANKLNQNDLLLDEKIEHWYKTELQSKQYQPNEEVWNKLSLNLDVASVWKRLSISLIRYNKIVWWRNTLLKSAAVLLFFIGITLTYQNNIQKNSIAKQNFTSPLITDNQSINNSITNSKKDSPISSINKTNNQQIKPDNNSENQLLANNNEPKNEKSSFINKHKKKNHILPKKDVFFANSIHNLPTIELNASSYQTIKQHYFAKEFLIKKKNNKIVFNNKRFTTNTSFGVYAKRFYLGLNTGIKKQNMITKINSSGALKNFNQQTLLNHGVSVGLTFGKIISDKLNIETNVNLYSTNGFKKKFNFADQHINEQLNLTYSSISFLAKRMYNKSTFDSKTYSTNIIGGVYLSYLNSSNSTINNKIISNKTYSNVDIGMILGVEQDRYLTKTLVITPGIRYYQGLKNIATNENSFSSAYNYAIEFNLGLKYIFLKKK